VDAKSNAGEPWPIWQTDPTSFGQPHLETVDALEKRGSANSHNCRSEYVRDRSEANIYDTAAICSEQADKGTLVYYLYGDGLQVRRLLLMCRRAGCSNGGR